MAADKRGVRMGVYEPYRQQSHELESRIRELMPDHNDPIARGLYEDARRLTEHFEREHNLRSAEGRIHTIQTRLRQLENMHEGPMSVDHSRALYDHFERIRRDMRGHKDY